MATGALIGADTLESAGAAGVATGVAMGFTAAGWPAAATTAATGDGDGADTVAGAAAGADVMPGAGSCPAFSAAGAWVVCRCGTE